MNIIMYCQYLLGIGHLVRTLAIAEELAHKHRVVIICGGRSLPELENHSNIEFVWLDPVASDANFSRCVSVLDPSVGYDQLVEKRFRKMKKAIKRVRPDVFWIESYPFARRRFRHEIVPAIRFIRSRLPRCRVCSSVRDVLLKKGGDKHYNESVVKVLNRYFDVVFVHSDPTRVPFELTFGTTENIDCPVIYTGYVCRTPKSARHRKSWEDGGDIVVNIGGSSTGVRILDAVLSCHDRYFTGRRMRLFIFPEDGSVLSDLESRLDDGRNVVVQPFTFDYINYLDEAAMAVCMGGYNSLIETVTTRTPALVIPFDGNQEQEIRIECLDRDGTFEKVELKNVSPDALAGAMDRLVPRASSTTDIDIGGTKFVCNYFDSL